MLGDARLGYAVDIYAYRIAKKLREAMDGWPQERVHFAIGVMRDLTPEQRAELFSGSVQHDPAALLALDRFIDVAVDEMGKVEA